MCSNRVVFPEPLEPTRTTLRMADGSSMRASGAFVFELMLGKIHGPSIGRGRYPTRARTRVPSPPRVTTMSASVLALVANAHDGTVSTFRVADGRLERLAVT